MGDRPQYAVEATATSIAVLETLTDAPGPVGITDLAAELDLAKSVVYNHVSTLRAEGYVAKRGTEYEPSARILALSDRIRRGFPVYRHAKESVNNLAAATGETTLLAVREGSHAVPIYIADGTTEWSRPFGVGEQLPLHATAPGKCLAASLPDDTLEDVLLDASPEQFTDTTTTDAPTLRTELRRVRDDGFAFCRSEHIEGVVGVAAPVPETESSRPAALGVCGPARSLSGRYLEEDITGQVLSTTKTIQVALADN
jgi:DNA-binding IclR family transcriptional regulator